MRFEVGARAASSGSAAAPLHLLPLHLLPRMLQLLDELPPSGELTPSSSVLYDGRYDLVRREAPLSAARILHRCLCRGRNRSSAAERSRL